LDDRRVVDARDDLKRALAVGACGDVNVEDAL